jgi:glycosyltransferase involved in cell wall biosynthesis
MLSNLGRADGGRETWAYNFIPRLLDRYRSLRLSIFGLRVDEQPDNRETLLSCVPEDQRSRLTVEFVPAKANRWPNAFSFWRGLRKLAQSKPVPAFVVAVGSWVELRAVLRSRGFRSSGKVVWLRSIFADEKAHRYPPFLRPLLQWIELGVLRQADVIIANGEDTADHYRKLGLSVRVIPNGVDLSRWRMEPPELSHPLKIAYVGRLAPVKGIDDFIDVARTAAEQALDWLEFHVIGEGPALPAVRDAEATGDLHCHGPIANEQMPALLSQMHVCVALTYVRGGDDRSSGGAGVSNALLEQMAAVRIIVAWDNAAFRQVLDDDTAYLVRQGDRAALLDALRAIHSEPAAARARSAKAARVAEDYGFDRHMDRFASAAARWLTANAVKPE